MKKWNKLLALGIVGIVVILGGCSMFESKTETLSKERQKNVVHWIARKYEVNDINFTDFQKDNVTGSYHLQFKLNNQYETGLTVNDFKEFNNPDGIITLGSIEDFRKIEKTPSLSENEKVDISNIKITYLGE